MTTYGQLYIVATPIGNLQDISARALEVLREVDAIAAEDTRHSKKLLQHYGIHTPLIAVHSDNEQRQLSRLLTRLKSGERLALISDAGTPLISDPGQLLVGAALSEEIPVIPLPGACALISALSVSGLPANRFHFEGFLPHKPGPRKKRLEALSKLPLTTVFYLSPHRVTATLDDFIACHGGAREGALVKEITKVHERVVRASLEEIQSWLLQAPEHQQGEFVLCVAGNPQPPEPLEAVSLESLLQVLLDELPVKQAAKMASKISQHSKKACYQLALQIKQDRSSSD